MQVETYEVAEAATNHPEVVGASLELIEQLGLVGQLDLVTGKSDKILPYRHMTEEEFFVYKSLLPAVTDVAEYKVGPIPLRVLQVLAHAKGMGHFAGFEVWYPRSHAVDDPVLVGVTKEGQYKQARYWILARWGDVLKPLAELIPFAVTKWRERMAGKIKEGIANAQSALARIEGMTVIGDLAMRNPNAEPYFSLPF